ncbi:hypothetical protein POPTR_014G076200v4 [Populus trichocarpa]|jgi:hypothetical protein|uniref:Uncharacterized protein n=1 Tax=Populus trichocarpa TaxID=3694 RepID=A0A3N7HPP7_POPTR|nr:hypothetical protein BDE02_14G061100 [Populus trichocarpa]RQO99804.2 hypothetical protein POPTR_014G076200v4 [Populus trichocarpa]
MKKALEVGCGKFAEWESLKREHKAYAFLAKGSISFPFKQCIADAITASSTDHFPREGIRNTLLLGDRSGRRSSWWLGKEQSNPVVPETLAYKLVSDIRVITELIYKLFKLILLNSFNLFCLLVDLY